MFQEETMFIKRQLNNDDLTTFTASKNLTSFIVYVKLDKAMMTDKTNDKPKSAVQSSLASNVCSS